MNKPVVNIVKYFVLVLWIGITTLIQNKGVDAMTEIIKVGKDVSGSNATGDCSIMKDCILNRI